MSTLIPNYYELRLTLTDIVSSLTHYVGNDSVINVGETLRVMLGDYFYGEPSKTMYQTYTSEERTLVWPLMGQTLFGQDLADAIDVLGEVFWTLADTLNAYVLRVNDHYDHRPSDCFYHFHPDSKVLVVYVPVIPGINDMVLQTQLDGRAVIQTCFATLPSFLRKN